MEFRNKVLTAFIVLFVGFQMQGMFSIKQAFKLLAVKGAAVGGIAALIHDISLRVRKEDRKLGLPSRIAIYGTCGLSFGNFTDRSKLFKTLDELKKDHKLLERFAIRNYKKQCIIHKEIKDIKRGVGQLGKGQNEIKEMLKNKPDKSWFSGLRSFININETEDALKTICSEFYEDDESDI